ncbi:MAG: Zn-dependent hydrolase [Anaerolineales bacterium]|nr:Zn-dependent hydrolase [Anaerolineales bacterium]
MSLLVDPDRLQTDFDALSAIGAIADETGARGVHRPSLSPAHLEARRWFLARAADAALETRVDAAGNHSVILRARRQPAPTLLLGSHLDSVPNGGRFDGALGVVAALEALRVIQAAGLDLPVDLEAIDFTDEEGTLVGLLGSSALAGSLAPGALHQPRGGRAVLEAGLARAGLDEARLLTARRDPASLAGYLELHIEQGPRLARGALAIGVVTGIVGITSYRVTFIGRANHAGTTPLDAREDAGLGASAFRLAAHALVTRDYADTGAVVNVGQMNFQPGAFNIIPGQAELALEFRAADARGLDELEDALLGLAGLVARQHGLQLQLEPVGTCAPAPMSPRVEAAISAAAASLALTHAPLVSGAGHDAQSLAPVTPSGMIFVPSRDGVSHSPREYTGWDDCVNGANVLLRAAVKLAEEADQPTTGR